MPEAARLTDEVAGTTAGEHMGHTVPHIPEAFSGKITGGCVANVKINGLPAAVAGSTTTERDGCCGSGAGTVAVGSGTVRIGGRPAARRGDTLTPHSGSGRIVGGSPNVRIGG